MSVNLRKAFEVSKKPVSLELQNEVEQFLYREAQLLDHQEFQQWFSLLEEDLVYWMPIRTNHTMKERDLEYVPENGNAHFCENYDAMRGRIRQRTSELNWAEDPHSRTRHLISNVLVKVQADDNEIEVASAFLLYRNRLERQVDVFAGERRDVLRRSNNELGFKIARRTILLDQSTLLANNLSVFF
jgi:biphenyl 2,3-dioxygenase subunit beta